MKSGEVVGRGELVVVGLTVKLAVGAAAVVEGVGVFGAIPLRIRRGERELRDWEVAVDGTSPYAQFLCPADSSHSIRAYGTRTGGAKSRERRVMMIDRFSGLVSWKTYSSDWCFSNAKSICTKKRYQSPGSGSSVMSHSYQ